MKKIFLNIKNQLIICFALLTFVSLLVSGLFVSSEVGNQVKNDYVDSLNNNIQQIESVIENYMVSINHMDEFISTNTNIFENLDKKISSYIDINHNVMPSINNMSMDEKNIYNELLSIKENNSFIDIIAIGSKNGGFIEYPLSEINTSYDPRQEKWYNDAVKLDIMENQGEIFIGEDNCLKKEISRPLIFDKEVLGVVKVQIDLSYLINLIKNIDLHDNEKIILVDKNGTIIGTSFSEFSILDNISNYFKNENKSTDVKIDGINYKIYNEELDALAPLFEWKIIALWNENQLNIGVVSINKIFFVAIIIATFLSILVTIIITNKIFKPMDQLTEHIQHIGNGHFDKEINTKFIKYKDEVGEIARSTSKMQESLKEMIEKNEFLAYHDNLTGLPNRINFLEKLEQFIKRKTNGAVFLLDIDNFKNINDALGHGMGDSLLKQISDRLKSIVNENIFISRFGGDEFLVVVSGTGEFEVVDSYAKKIYETCQYPFILDGESTFINFSMGVTFYPKDSNNVEQLLMNADTAMYKAKSNGKRRYVYFDSKMKEEIQSKKEIEETIRWALKTNNLNLNYQPQIDTNTGSISGFEALLRIKNNKYRPDIFIPVAEECGLIVDVGRWVIKETLLQMVKWREMGYDLKPIAINFSCIQLRDNKYIDYLVEKLNEYHISSEYIEIEITESVLLKHDEKTIDFLGKLKENGFKIALDDFGTGYSSLNYLTYIPVDRVKLDKSLIEKFITIGNADVIESLIALIHSLGLEVVAEGVESGEKAQILINHGCDYIQGYLYSRPEDGETISEIYNSCFFEYEQTTLRM